MNRAGADALRIALLLKQPQCFGAIHDGEADSALGVLHRAAHPTYGCPAITAAKERRVYSLYANCVGLIDWTFRFESCLIRCSCCALNRSYGSEGWLIEHYNDVHLWTFGQIALALVQD